jgi:TP901 family phage tail tape measure protein
MAVKAGTAFVDIKGDFSALNKQVSSQAGKQFGSKLGNDFTAGFKQGTSGLGSDVGKQATSGKSQMSRAGRTLGREFASSFGSSVHGIGRDISASLHQNAVRGIKATATGVAAAFVYTIKTAADFEKQMSNLGAVTNASTKQMARFEKQALRAGAKTKFSAKEAAQAQTELAKGGLSVQQILSGGLDAALGLAAAGEMDLADAASTTVNAMKLFNIRGKDSMKVADAFATAANATTADVSDFAMSLSQGGSAAKTAGLSFQDTTAWLEALASSGIKGSDAGTSLKSALVQLSSPSLQASHAMKDLGLKFYDAHGNIKSVVEISGMLRKSMGGMSKEQRIQTAVTLAGTDGMRGLLALYDAGPTKMGKFEKGLQKSGTAADTAKKKQDNLSGSLENLGGSVETLAIEVGTGMLPGIRKVTGQLTNFTNDVGKIFENKDLDFGEKMNAIFAKAEFRFGPMVAQIQQAIKDAHLDDKLAGVVEWAAPKMLAAFKTVGIAAAKALWEGFKAAPIWAQVGGGAWLVTKLGLTGPAFKLLTTLLTGKGLGGGAGGLISKASPIPVWVVNQGGLPIPGGKGPGGGAPLPIPGGRLPGGGGGGVLGKLRMGGKFLGKAGLIAGAIDLGINLIDSKGNPIAAIQNSAHDLTFGLVPEFKGATEEAAAKIKGIALKLPLDVQAKLPANFNEQLTNIQKDIDKHALAIKSRTQVAAPQIAAAAPDAVGPIAMALSRANAADEAAVAAAGKRMGKLYAEQYVAGVNEHHQFFGGDELTKGFTEQLKGLPQAARQQAFDTMVNWANTLVQQGRLPGEALGTIIRGIKSQFNLLPTGIEDPARRGVDSVTRQFQRQDMIAAANKQLADLKRIYGQFPSIGRFTGHNMSSNFITEINALQSQASTATGKLKTQTEADLRGVQRAAVKYGHAANNGLNDELKDMGIKGDKHAKKIRDSIVKAFVQMATGTGTASEETANTLYKALSNMNLNAADILTALGLKVPSLKLTKLQKQGKGGVSGTVGAQRGQYIDGSGTGDKIPAMLEPGEYVVNRKAVSKIGKDRLDRLNFADAPRFQSGGLVQLIGKANQIDAMKYPYLWGGGHDPNFSGPYDCSGAISAILHAAGLLQMPMVSGDFMNFGQPGPGGEMTIYANPGHVYGRIGTRFWGTSGQNPGGGAGYFDGSARLGFTVRHVDMVDPTLAAQSVIGMPGMLTDASQGIIDHTQKSYQSYINDRLASLGSIGGGDDGDSATATGNGADLMRAISKARGWNFPDWWALDESETGHGANLANPTSTARLRGQFLDMNYGKYGPGSDPSQNPSMGQQIQSMASYIAQRYGNPTRAWAFHKANNFYQRGGSVLSSLFAPGGMVNAVSSKVKDKAPKVKNKTIDNLLHSKKHKPSDHLTAAMVTSLRKAGADRLSASMSSLKLNADTYADWAERANSITNTDALQTALNAEMTRRGGRSSMSEAALLGLFPAADQDAFINNWLHGNANFGGGIQSDWLSKELEQLLGWRNALIDNPPLFQKLIDAAIKAYNKLKNEIKRIEDDIAKLTKKRDAAIRREEDKHQARVDAKKDLDAERKKKHPDRSRVARLSEHVARYRNEEAAAHQDRVNLNAELAKLHGDDRNAKKGTQILGGDDGQPGDKGDNGRIGDLNQAVKDMASSLVDVHGLGSTMTRFVSPSQFQLGTLGGTILSVQNEILGITRNAPRASAVDAEAAPPEDDSATKEILAQLLREANLRVGVSEAQYDVFRNLPGTFGNYPFGGVFHQGGTVPGPVGAPRMILAQGGEVVLTNEDANAGQGPAVSLHFANGMEWLRQFVSVQVDNQTRAQGRRGERQLPGRAGTLR